MYKTTSDDMSKCGQGIKDIVLEKNVQPKAFKKIFHGNLFVSIILKIKCE